MRLLLVVAWLLSGTVASAQTRTTLAVPGGAIMLDIEAGTEPTQAAIVDWVQRAAHAVSAFYGRFPVSHVRVQVTRGAGDRLNGTTYMGRFIRMGVGSGVTAARLAGDWTMTHEMFHLAFPQHDDMHVWMQEGMATYFEPIARARAGELGAERYWRDLFSGLKNGLPRDGDRGLDHTPTWGRTYWGGALFWFVADLGIREATGNKRSADDVLRALLAAGGDGTEEWPMAKILEIGDRATGTTVLSDTYRRMADQPAPVDLDALAARLGVGKTLDDKAPLAAIRRSITAPPAP